MQKLQKKGGDKEEEPFITFHYVSLCFSSRSGFVIIKKGEIVESSLDFDDNKTIYVYLTCLLSMQRFTIHLINGSLLKHFSKESVDT